LAELGIKICKKVHCTKNSSSYPPESRFKGKILFIFSNPEKAAKSAFFMRLHEYDKALLLWEQALPIQYFKIAL
jgi:hypothetical protein